MTTFGCKICKICCDTCRENDMQVINGKIMEMFKVLLIEIDLAPGEDTIICNTCVKKLEKHFNFKQKCIFTDNSTFPVAAKLDLNGIKFEEDGDKIVCRLCLQLIDNDMTLNEMEINQFQRCFPEINLNVTNYVLFCSTCYNFLQKHFLFMMPFIESKEKCLDYRIVENNEANGCESLENKCETKTEKEMLLNEEIDIKKEEEFEEEKCDIEDHLQSSSPSKFNVYKCEQCDYSSDRMRYVKTHVKYAHIDPTKLETFQCNKCDYKTNYQAGLTTHVRKNHPDNTAIDYDPSLTKSFKCKECQFQTKYHNRMRMHMKCKHGDLSNILTFQCKECTFQSKYFKNLTLHMKHVHPSAVQMHQCEECDFETKYRISLKNHVEYMHNDNPKKLHECQRCDYKSKRKYNLKTHIKLIHGNVPA